jgi:hypothetical protein
VRSVLSLQTVPTGSYALAGEAGAGRAAIAASMSADRISPPGPLPLSVARSMPLSCASRRALGEI